MNPRLNVAVHKLLASRGYEMRRHPAARRQQIFAQRGVDLVLDVGASDGGYGRQLRSFGYQGRIVSFEPLLEPFTRLQEATSQDPRWTVRQHALGAVPGTATMNVASNSASSSLLPMEAAHYEAEPSVRFIGSESVRVETLDGIVDDVLADAQQLFVKLDAQGFERQILAGGTEAVARAVGIQLELSFVPLYEGGLLIDEAMRLMYDAGFRLEVFEQGWAAPSGQMLQADGVFFRA